MHLCSNPSCASYSQYSYEDCTHSHGALSKEKQKQISDMRNFFENEIPYTREIELEKTLKQTVAQYWSGKSTQPAQSNEKAQQTAATTDSKAKTALSSTNPQQ